MMQQPAPMVTAVQQPPDDIPGYGIGAIVFATITIFTLFFLGCLWTLPCTAISLVLGITVSEV